MKDWKPALLLAGLALCRPFFAQTPLNLTVEKSVEYAVQNNVSIQQGKITLEASRRDKNHSWNSISPSLSASAGLTRPNKTDSYDWSAYVQGSVSISFSPNLFTSIKSARIAYEQGEINYNQAVRKIELSVRETFYGLLYEKDNIELQKRNLETAKSQWENNKAKYNQGRMSELDVLSAEVSYQNLIPKLESAIVTYKNDLAAFKQLLGLDLESEITLSGSLDDAVTSKEITLEGTEINSPDLALAEKKVEAAKSSLLSARFSAYSPTISAGWNYQPSLTSKDGVRTDPKDSGSLRLTATIPLDGILPWSSSNDKVDAAKDSVKSQELALQDAKTSLEVDIESSLRQIRQSQSAIKSKESSVELAKKTYEMTLQAYNRGTKDLLSLQDANDSMLSAEVSLKSEQLTLIKSVLELENLIGVEFNSLGK